MQVGNTSSLRDRGILAAALRGCPALASIARGMQAWPGTSSRSTTTPRVLLAVLLAMLLQIVLLVAAPAPGRAEASGGKGERTLCVHGVADDATLAVHARPAGRSRIIGRLQPGACGLKLAGRCRGEWCDMVLGDVRGWVSSRYVGVYELAGGEGASGSLGPAGGASPGSQAEERLSSAPAAGPRGVPAIAAQPSRETVATATIASIQPAPAPAQAAPTPPPVNRREADEAGGGSASLARPGREPRAARAVRSRPVVARVVVRPSRGDGGRRAGGGWLGACVVGVESWDTLRIRRGPGVEHRAIGGIPAGACRVSPAGGCHGPWCRVAWRGWVGWVNAVHLR